MGTRNRRAGHAWELKCKKNLSFVYPHLVSSRSESKNRDDQKVDLMNLNEYKNGKCPYNFQCKSICGTVNYHNILGEMPVDDGINVILHTQTKKSNKRFITVGNYAILNALDFEELKISNFNYRQIIKKSKNCVSYHKIITKSSEHFKGEKDIIFILHSKFEKNKPAYNEYVILKLENYYSILHEKNKP